MTTKKDKCLCPYCGFVLSCDQFFCKTCKIEFVVCEECSQVMRKDAAICPHCGSKKKNKENE